MAIEQLAALTDRFLRAVSFETGGTQDGVAFAARGVISTQFIRTPAGWKMSSMAWDDERPGLALPDR